MEEMYKQGQLDLIRKIKEDVAKLVASEPEGFDLALDIIHLLQRIKPIEIVN